MRPPPLLAPLIAAAGLAACGAGELPARARPDLVLVVLCTFRTSHMGAAGYARDTTPFLDSLAARGLFFENAVSASSWTKPATASLLTGLTPNVHRMTDFDRPRDVRSGRLRPRVLADGIVTLAETLREAGYATAARINNVHVSEHFNMTQGFDDAVARASADTAQLVRELGSWAAGVDPGTPVFLFLMSRDAHVPFDPNYAWYERFNRVEPPVPPELYPHYARAVRTRAVAWLRDPDAPPDADLQTRYVDLYDAELAELDRALSELPEALERAGRAGAFLFVTADHGEHLFDHRLLGHGPRLDDAVLRVPLIATGPGLPARRVPDLVRSIDVYPTLAALAGARVPAELQGRELLAGAAGGLGSAAPAAPSAFASVYENEHMVRRGSYSYYARKGGERELFDLAADPGELEDLAGRRPEVARELERELERWSGAEAALRERVAPGPERELADDAVLELRRLGYLDP